MRAARGDNAGVSSLLVLDLNAELVSGGFGVIRGAGLLMTGSTFDGYRDSSLSVSVWKENFDFIDRKVDAIGLVSLLDRDDFCEDREFFLFNV